MIVRISGIRKFTFDVSDKNGTAHREFRRGQVEFVRLQSLRKMTGEGIGKQDVSLSYSTSVLSSYAEDFPQHTAKLRSKETLRLVWAVRYKVSSTLNSF